MGVIRKTKSVDAVLGIFNKTTDAISVAEMIDRLKHNMNKTTVYRILERLEEDCVLHSLIDKDGLKWYAKCTTCSGSKFNHVHPHFQCSSCGRVDCLPVDIKVPLIKDRQVQSVRYLLVGICEKCI